MSYKEWSKHHTMWMALGSAIGATSGITAANLIGHWWFSGLLVCAIVAFIVSILIPYSMWFFGANGRKAQP